MKSISLLLKDIVLSLLRIREITNVDDHINFYSFEINLKYIFYVNVEFSDEIISQ